MNDRDPFDPIDRTLSSAFGSRHVPAMPSASGMSDVRHRARRRQQRRTAALVGAVTLVGAGGVGAYALRHDDGRAALTPGDAVDNGAPATTIACFTIATTVPPLPTVSTVSGLAIYEVKDGDTPMLVAQKFDLTVDALNAANADLVGYDAFNVGLTITIPAADPLLQGTTTLPPLPGVCGPDVGWTWHCTGELGMDEFGRQIFESCEQVEPGLTTVPGEVVPASTTPGQPVGTTTTMYPGECPPGSYCLPPPGLTVPPTTVPTSVNGNVGEPSATSTTSTIAIYESTTTSLG